MKLIVVTILKLWPDIYAAGEWLLSWTRVSKGDALQVVVYVQVDSLQCLLIEPFLQFNGHFPHYHEYSPILAYRLYR